MTNVKRRYCALLLPFLWASPAAAQAPAPPVVLDTDAAELSIGGRVQAQLNTTSVEGEPDSELILRRARLEIGVKLDDFVSAVIQPEFSGDRVSLKDTYVNLGFSPAVELRVGKMQRPFGIFDQTSSKRMPVIERGLRIRGLTGVDEYLLTSGMDYGDRDLGAMLLGAPEGAPLGLAYEAGIFRGPLHGEVGPQDSYQFAGRVTAAVAEDLRLGAGWSNRQFSDDVGTSPTLRRGNAFELDLEYGSFAPGLHVIAQISTGEIDPFAATDFVGGHAWLAYRSQPLAPRVFAIEPVFRVSHARIDQPASVTGGTLLTPGINLYFTPLTRAMLNYDVWRGADGGEDATSFKAMLQVAF